MIIGVISASNLPNLETIGKIDPYVNIQFKGWSCFCFFDNLFQEIVF